MDELLTVPEVAALLRVDRRTVGRWVASGKLPAIRVVPRGRWRIRRADVQALLKANRAEESTKKSKALAA